MAAAAAALVTMTPSPYLDHLVAASGNGGGGGIDDDDAETAIAAVMADNNNETAGQTMANFSLASSGGKRDFVFDRTDVRVIFVTLYSMVFCCCFFGKSFFL